MKKAAIIFFLALLALTPTRVFATNSTPTGIRNTLRTKLAEHAATREARLSLVRRERIRAFWGRMLTRIEAMVERLERLIARMEARIGQIEALDENIDTSVAKDDIAEAKKLIVDIKADLETAKTQLEQVIGSEDPKAAFKDVINTVQGIKTNLIEVHRLLVHAIGSIKGLRVTTPTSTP
jgi:hypothetical protein